MSWLYLIILMFSALTLCLVYEDYRKKQFSKRAFNIVSIMESIVIIITAILLIKSFGQI